MISEMQEFAGRLTAAGVHTAIDPRDVRVPGAWIAAQDAADFYADGSYSINLDIYLVTQNSGTAAALKSLAGMFAKVVALHTDIVSTSFNVALDLPASGKNALPSFRISTTLEIGSPQ